MRLIGCIAIVALSGTTVRCETRFLNLSLETVQGRKVKIASGSEFFFFANHIFEIRHWNGKVSKGKWEIFGRSIQVTYQGGSVWNYGPYLIDNVTYLKPQFGRTHQAPLKVISIEALN